MVREGSRVKVMVEMQLTPTLFRRSKWGHCAKKIPR